MVSPVFNLLLSEQTSELTMSGDQGSGSSESNGSEVDHNRIQQILIDEEKNLRIFVDLMDNQPFLDWITREFVLEFVMSLASHLNLSPETFFLAIDILDRYTRIRVISTHYYQLFGIVSLWISAKSSDNKSIVPKCQLLVDLCFNSFSKADIKRAELEILQCLNWDFSAPMLDFFVGLSLEYHIRLANSKEDIINTELQSYYDLKYNLALYLCELLMFRGECYCFSTATVGICGYYLANHLLRFDLLATLPIMDTDNGNDCLQLMYRFAPHPIESVRSKYSTEEYCYAAVALDDYLEIEARYKMEFELYQEIERRQMYLNFIHHYLTTA